MQFSSMNFVPNYVSDDGVNRSTPIPVIVAFIAANHLNQLITFCLKVVAA